MSELKTKKCRIIAVVLLAGMLLWRPSLHAEEAAIGAGRIFSGGQDPAKAFAMPPDEYRPWVYWWWINGNASKEGITRDMEEMKSKGINGALLFDAGEAGSNVPRGPHFMSPEWRALYKHALAEADRCGVVLTVNLCSGWNCGGAWVTPEHAIKKLVSSQTMVRGPGKVSMALRKPPATRDFYRDIGVLAVPTAADPLAEGKLVASSQLHDNAPAMAKDGDAGTRWVSRGDKPGMGPTPEKPEYLQFDFSTAQKVAGVYLQPYKDCGPKDVEILCSDDGVDFRLLKKEALKPQVPVTIAFDEAAAKHFRIRFVSAQPYQKKDSSNVQVAEIRLLSKEQVADKTPLARFKWNRGSAVDVTGFMDPEGKLNWDPPAGSWRVLRIGYTITGKNVSCCGSGPTGLEIDPMSAEAMDAHFAETGAKLIADAGPLVGKTLQYFHIDSWEIGEPNWTPRMREEFQKRRGYDPLSYLPAVLGHTLDNAEESARFMQDYRRTVADLVAANYYGRLEELSVKGGLRGTHPESGGPFFTHWIDPLECLGRTAVPMGEFWKRNSEPNGGITWHNNPSVRQAASAAHIYGKPVCQAEAYTCFADDWIENPWNMKDIGDAAFCEGLTRQVLCFWVHQARLDARPGFQWAHVGTHFDPHLTWWPMSDGWLTYIARCQYLLRQGHFVADFACLQSEAIPAFITNQSPSGSRTRPGQDFAVPAGYDYDAMNAEVLLTRASAKDGRLMLQNGPERVGLNMSYRYLALPFMPDAVLSPGTLKKVSELAEAGVPVIGPKSFVVSVPKLRDSTMADAVRADGLAPDLEFVNQAAAMKFDWIHRRAGETEIYFVSNQTTNDVSVNIAFRVADKHAELWDAVTGEIRELPEYREEKARTLVPLRFAPRQSWFVVFLRKTADSGSQARPSNTAGSQARPSRGEGQAEGKWRAEPATPRNFPETKPVLELTGDATLPADQRRTTTNVQTYEANPPAIFGCKECKERNKTGKPAELLPSGLLGPVRVMAEQ